MFASLGWTRGIPAWRRKPRSRLSATIGKTITESRPADTSAAAVTGVISRSR